MMSRIHTIVYIGVAVLLGTAVTMAAEHNSYVSNVEKVQNAMADADVQEAQADALDRMADAEDDQMKTYEHKLQDKKGKHQKLDDFHKFLLSQNKRIVAATPKLAAAGTVKQKPSKLKKEMVQHNKLSQNNKADKKKNKTKFSGMSHKTALSKDFARFKSKFVEAHTKVATLKNGAADPGTKQKKAAMKGPNFYPEPLRAEYARFVAKKRAENSEDAGDTKANAVEPIIDEQGAPVEEELLQWVKEFY